jgi:hypothetical protein
LKKYESAYYSFKMNTSEVIMIEHDASGILELTLRRCHCWAESLEHDLTAPCAGGFVSSPSSPSR